MKGAIIGITIGVATIGGYFAYKKYKGERTFIGKLMNDDATNGATDNGNENVPTDEQSQNNQSEENVPVWASY